MTARAILAGLLAHGIELECTPDGQNLLVPAGCLTPQQRALVLAHKPELIRLVLEADHITQLLLQAAMRASGQWSDSRAAKEQLRQDCLNTPPQFRADLLAHLSKQYPGEQRKPSKGKK